LAPPGASHDQTHGSSIRITPRSGSGQWTVGTVKKKKTVTLGVVATVDSPNPQTNTATIGNADQFDPNTFNNTDSAAVVPQ
jgi:hypothetical protein